VCVNKIYVLMMSLSRLHVHTGTVPSTVVEYGIYRYAPKSHFIGTGHIVLYVQGCNSLIDKLFTVLILSLRFITSGTPIGTGSCVQR
jgi:hypothetical protein